MTYRVLKGLEFLLSVFPLSHNKVMIFNYDGKGFGDNGKYIAQQLIKRNPNVRVIWPVKGKCNNKKIANVSFIRYRSLAFFYHLATSRCWVSNYRMPLYVRKRKGQLYVQTWHGCVALKRIEKDAEELLGNWYVDQAMHDSQLIDVMISNGSFCTRMYKNAFWYDGVIKEYGSPRLKPLFIDNSNLKKIISRDYHFSNEKKVVLYAPTFRDDHDLSIYDIDVKRIEMQLKRSFGGDWVVLFRLHPSLAGNVTVQRDCGIDVSDYPDMYELLAISDVLITDYSSTMFEFGYQSKTVLLYMPDMDKYIKDRNFYFDIKDLPYPMSTSQDELIELIKRFDKSEYDVKVKEFNESLGIKEDGKASERVSSMILRWMRKY